MLRAQQGETTAETQGRPKVSRSFPTSVRGPSHVPSLGSDLTLSWQGVTAPAFTRAQQ